MKRQQRALLVLSCLLWPVAAPAQTARPVLAAIFADHAVLQRGRPIPVYGNAAPGAHVTVTLGQARVAAEAGANGRWSASLPAMPAGGPFTLTASIEGGQSQAIADVSLFRPVQHGIAGAIRRLRPAGSARRQ